jgi:hypothetical protein
MHGIFQRRIGLKADIRRHPQPHFMRHLRSQEWRDALQRRQFRIDVRAPKPRHEGGRVLQIR